MDIGIKIKNLRIDANMDQSEFAHEIGLSRPHLANIECGHKSASYALVCVIADMFKKELEYFRP